jgi:(p)ppGpp synthase/HD superfamily hydrolase
MTRSSWTQEAYIKALRFAAKAHGGQIVPGTEFPYLAHLSMVAMEVMAALAIEEGLDGDLAVQCALLHDVMEDTQTIFEQVEKEFGLRVAQGVLALSKDSAKDKAEQLGDSLKRIVLTSREVWMVKLADRITNLQPPPSHWTYPGNLPVLKREVEPPSRG